MKKSLFSISALLFLAVFAPVFAQNPAFSPKTPANGPVAGCRENGQIAIGPGQSDAADCQNPNGANGLTGTAALAAADLDDGSFDPLGQPVFFKIKRASDVDGPFVDSLFFGCGESGGAAIEVVFRVYDVPPGAGAVAGSAFLGHFSDCLSAVFVVDKIAPFCKAPAAEAISCDQIAPLPWPGGLVFFDNCGIASIDTSFEYLPSEQDFFQKKYGQARRIFTVKDCAGNASVATQELTVNYREQFRLQFPDDLVTSVCDSSTVDFANWTVGVFGEDCELIGISHEDALLNVVPDACLKIIRTFRAIDWKTYNPTLADIVVPNPSNSTKAPTIWVGADANNQFSWALADPAVPDMPTVGPRAFQFPEPLTGSLPTQFGTPAIVYTTFTKITDDVPPTVLPADYTFCDIPPNDPNQWNEIMPCNPYGLDGLWDPIDQSHDLREAVVDLSLTATDACSRDDIYFRFLLFLDLNGDGVMETTINSENPSWGFGLKEDETSNGHRTARITRDVETDNCAPLFNFPKIPNFTLPKGNHKIKWTVEDRCGNDFTKEYPINVGKCPVPSLLCRNYLKINQLSLFSNATDPTATRSAVQFVRAISDNITPVGQLQYALRDPGINPGTGFPKDAAGKPAKSLTWDCDQLGQRPLELWVGDPQGNTATCPTTVFLKDATMLCPMDSLGQPAAEFRADAMTDLGAAGGFELFQNRPNPFSEMTEIPFSLPADGAATLRVFDALGRLVFEKSGSFGAGASSFFLEKEALPGGAFLGFYQVLTADGSAARRLVFEGK